jgi:hypothetical protein
LNTDAYLAKPKEMVDWGNQEHWDPLILETLHIVAQVRWD